MATTTTSSKKSAGAKRGNSAQKPASPPKRVRSMASRTVKKTPEAAAPHALKAEEVAAFVGRKAEGATLFVGHKAEGAAAYVGHKTEGASAAVGSGLRALGATVREHAPDGGVAGDASSAVADTLESGGRYLQEEGFTAMGEDVTGLIRRNPVLSLLIGVAAGFLAGKVTAQRS